MGTSPHRAVSHIAPPCSVWVDVSVVSPASLEGSLACLLWPPWSGALWASGDSPASPATLWACCRAGQLVQEDRGPERWAAQASIYQLSADAS